MGRPAVRSGRWAVDLARVPLCPLNPLIKLKTTETLLFTFNQNETLKYVSDQIL